MQMRFAPFMPSAEKLPVRGKKSNEVCSANPVPVMPAGGGTVPQEPILLIDVNVPRPIENNTGRAISGLRGERVFIY
jgi:hypothetical protein